VDAAASADAQRSASRHRPLYLHTNARALMAREVLEEGRRVVRSGALQGRRRGAVGQRGGGRDGKTAPTRSCVCAVREWGEENTNGVLFAPGSPAVRVGVERADGSVRLRLCRLCTQVAQSAQASAQRKTATQTNEAQTAHRGRGATSNTEAWEAGRALLTCAAPDGAGGSKKKASEFFKFSMHVAIWGSHARLQTQKGGRKNKLCASEKGDD
jgi:hypothetical protein